MPKKITWHYPWVGVSGFLAQNKNFPGQKYLECYPPNLRKPIMPILWGSAGTGMFTLVRFHNMYAHGPHAFLVHLSNEAGRRSGKLTRTDLLPQYDTVTYNRYAEDRRVYVRKCIKSRVKEICDTFTAKFYQPRRLEAGEIMPRLFISTGLESKFNLKATKFIVDCIKSAWTYPVHPPKIIHCPINGQSKGGNFLELHGKNPNFGGRRKKGILNLDGCTIDFKDGENYMPGHPEAHISFSAAKKLAIEYEDIFAVIFWSASHQGLQDATGWGSAGAPPIKKRKPVISQKSIDGMKELLLSYEPTDMEDLTARELRWGFHRKNPKKGMRNGKISNSTNT